MVGPASDPAISPAGVSEDRRRTNGDLSGAFASSAARLTHRGRATLRATSRVPFLRLTSQPPPPHVLLRARPRGLHPRRGRLWDSPKLIFVPTARARRRAGPRRHPRARNLRRGASRASVRLRRVRRRVTAVVHRALRPPLSPRSPLRGTYPSGVRLRREFPSRMPTAPASSARPCRPAPPPVRSSLTSSTTSPTSSPPPSRQPSTAWRTNSTRRRRGQQRRRLRGRERPPGPRPLPTHPTDARARAKERRAGRHVRQHPPEVPQHRRGHAPRWTRSPST